MSFKEKKLLKGPPIGTDLFIKTVGKYYVDKTLLIKDILDFSAEVLLFTRPRRFGKTLNMTMLQTFFEKPLDGEDTSHYFKDLQIWQKDEKYRAEQGKRPVIFITFKDVKFSSYKETSDAIKLLISSEYVRHGELFSSGKLSEQEKNFYNSIVGNNAPESHWADSFKMLSRMLLRHYGEQVLVLIDEYDAPIQAAYDHGFYDRMVIFMRNFLSSVLKTNPSLYRGILTGITRVSKESIFSGLNNIKVNTVFDKDFCQYFGFTQEEVNEMLDFYELGEKEKAEVKEWYDGYKFGNMDIYNPWSVLNYLAEDCTARAYWTDTSANEMVGDMLEDLSRQEISQLEKVLNGGTIIKDIATNIIYPELKKKSSLVYSLLVQTGYLKSINTVSMDDSYSCELKIPNRELYSVYAREIIGRFIDNDDTATKAISMRNAVLMGDVGYLQETISEYLRSSCSYFDMRRERDYHNFMLGLLVAVSIGYTKSNRESGDGRYDIILMPKKADMPGIIFELKHHKATKEERGSKAKKASALKLEALDALAQIERMGYEEELRRKGVKQIIKYGAAFSGKTVHIEKK